MLKNYFIIAWRNIFRQKIYSSLNIAGLTSGIIATLLILLYVQYEYSFDQFHAKKDRIYRITREWVDENGNSELHLAQIAPPIGPLLKNDFEGIVENSARFLNARNSLLTANEKPIREDALYFAEESAFSIFSWDLIQGNTQSALTEPNSIVLSESLAKKYFNNTEEAIGKDLEFENFNVKVPMKITGIMKDIPENTHLRPAAIASFATVENFFGKEALMRNYGSNNYPTYVLLEPEKTISELEKGIPDFINK